MNNPLVAYVLLTIGLWLVFAVIVASLGGGVLWYLPLMLISGPIAAKVILR